MGLDRDLLGRVRSLDEFDLRRLAIFVRGLLVSREGHETAAAVAGPSPAGRVSYRQQMVRCGRKACTRCPHGPYWYAYWREGGRVRSRYIGKTLPEARPPGPGPGD
ncbi:MAG: hypothetical protein HY658_03410 [Actinobacteria bacterium]|nr:hypothetical protein [Actinomycetota bacterium]